MVAAVIAACINLSSQTAATVVGTAGFAKKMRMAVYSLVVKMTLNCVKVDNVAVIVYFEALQ